MNEKGEKYEGQDEGEYHFSDEHSAYDVDTETAKVGDVSTAQTSTMSTVARFRRPLIAMGVFVVLMFVVYKVISPTSNTPMEISQGAPKTTVAKTVQHTTPPPVQQVATTTTSVTTQQQPVATPAPSQPVVAQNIPAAPLTQPVTNLAPAGMPDPMASPNQQVGTVQYDANKELLDRLASLEQQNAKLTNIMQIEYAQKLADSENQAVAAQAKIKELSARVAGMESALTQVTQILQGSGRQVSMPNRGSAPGAAQSAGPKQIYTVQAIIPGRAWLKSEAGDTVTVAEGDVLRDYGRVTKIDPYDGVVNIDTGNKMVSLSYGSSGD